MSEEKKPRSIAEIQAQYQSLCTRAGHLQYQIDAIGKDLVQVNEALRNLNFEAVTAQNAEAEAAKAAATAPTPVSEGKDA